MVSDEVTAEILTWLVADAVLLFSTKRDRPHASIKGARTPGPF